MPDPTRLPGDSCDGEVVAVITCDGGVITEDMAGPEPDDSSGRRTRRMAALFAKCRRVVEVVLVGKNRAGHCHCHCC